MTDETTAAGPDADIVETAATGFPGTLKAYLEVDGARYFPPFLMWTDGGEVVLGLVAGTQVVASGAMSPEAARELASALLEYADLAEAEAKAPPGDDPASRPLENLWSGPARDGWNALSKRTVNALLWDGYKTVADLTSATAADLTDIRNFGAGCLGEVKRVLAAHGFALAGEETSGA